MRGQEGQAIHDDVMEALRPYMYTGVKGGITFGDGGMGARMFVGMTNLLTSFIPIVGPASRAMAAIGKGDRRGAILNAMLAAAEGGAWMSGISKVSTGGSAAKGGTESFGSMMENGEAARYAKYWESYAPKQISPSTTRMDWLRVSGRTGRMESSRVIYDDYGRQTYRVDFSDHMRPLDHSYPHLHQYEYGPNFSIKGKETLFNFWKK